MKLIIQIPCLNESETLRTSLDALPKSIEGIDEIEILIIDDGSTDNTVEVAREWGVHHICKHSRNLGLARGFLTGLKGAVERGADIIVNTDADNQYCADDITKLVQPIIAKQADIVIGSRPIKSINDFSPLKKILQRLGSWVVRTASGVDVPDAPSGFRAFSRDTAMKLNVFNEYTYTLETIIQAGQSGLIVQCVPIRVNGFLRPSRLMSSIPSYIRRSVMTIFRIYAIYRPLQFFMLIAVALFVPGLVFGGRFLVLFMIGEGDGHIQSLILAAVLLLAGFQVGILGVIGDMLSSNRKLLEKIQYEVRKASHDGDDA